MNRRQLLASGIALGCGGLRPAFGQSQPRAGGPHAIAEGGPLTPPADHPIQVAIAISPGTTWIDFVGPMAVFETFAYDPVAKKYKPRFRTTLVSETLERADNLIPDHTFQTAPEAQIILVPAQPGSPALLEWLRNNADKTDITMSVCTGARHLARAGLLDGHQATTHHKSIDEFEKQFPEVKWVRGMRYVEGKKISTGGGLTAGIDLALRVTERYFGRESAQTVADHLEYQSTGWIV